MGMKLALIFWSAWRRLGVELSDLDEVSITSEHQT